MPQVCHDPALSSRRAFLAGAGGLAASAAIGGAHPSAAAETTPPASKNDGPQRRNRAAQIRHDAEMMNRQAGVTAHPTNGDEARFENKIGSYSKALPHNALGEVDLAA